MTRHIFIGSRTNVETVVDKVLTSQGFPLSSYTLRTGPKHVSLYSPNGELLDSKLLNDDTNWKGLVYYNKKRTAIVALQLFLSEENLYAIIPRKENNIDKEGFKKSR